MEQTMENWAELPSLAEVEAQELAEVAAFVLDSKKGRDIAVIPVEGRSDITDFLVLASATSSTHVRALADEVEFRLGQRGVTPLHTDGGDHRSWIVVDYGTVMIHVFDREAREFYHLDKLYGDVEPTSPSEED